MFLDRSSHALALSLTDHPGVLYLLGAAFALYFGGRLAADGLTAVGRAPTAVRVALGHVMPIAFVAVAAALSGADHVAVTTVFAAAVATLSLNLGLALTSADDPAHLPAAPPTAFPPSARAWAFLVPAAVLCLMAGFSARLNALHAILLAAQGAVIALVWSAPPPPPRQDETGASPASVLPLPADAVARPHVGRSLLGVAVAAVGAWAAVRMTGHVSEETRIMSPGLVATVVLGPLLVLPLIGTCTALAQQGLSRVAVEASVAIALLCLCLVLPLMIGAWYLRPLVFPPAPLATPARAATPTVPATTQSATQPATQAAEDAEESFEDFAATASEEPEVFTPMAYPMGTWRVDTVMLIVIGLLLLPVAMSRWWIGRREGVVLVLGYVVYLLLSTKLGTRW